MTKFDSRTLAGALLFVGSVQWLLVVVVAEGLYPGYSSRVNYISYLGVGSTSLIFNPSLFLLGVGVVAGAYFIQRAFGVRFFPVLLTLAGLGAMAAALFPETIQPAHGIGAGVAFVFGGLSAITSYKLQKPPLSYASVLLGALTLVAVILFYPYLGLATESTVTYLGLGKGGMERLIAYPTLLWLVGFGSHLIGRSTDTATDATKNVLGSTT